MRISGCSSDVCSSDLGSEFRFGAGLSSMPDGEQGWNARFGASLPLQEDRLGLRVSYARNELPGYTDNAVDGRDDINGGSQTGARAALVWDRSEEHTSELQSLMRISYAVFCLKKKTKHHTTD